MKAREGGFSLTRDRANARPEMFRTGVGWFAYNIVANAQNLGHGGTRASRWELRCYHSSSSHAMRTIIDLPEEQVQRLGGLCRREGVSRAEAVRRAVTDYLNAHSMREQRDAFGIWRERRPDGLEYERRLRREWS